MLTMISPANTATEITDRGYPNVNRVCGRDDVQGPVGARFTAQDLKLKSVYIIHDKTLYGQGVAENFRNEAKKLGLNVLGFDGTEERANFSPMIIPLKAKNPDLVYFGGIYHQGGLLLKQLREKGVKAKFMHLNLAHGKIAVVHNEIVERSRGDAEGAAQSVDRCREHGCS